jgi:hypothetical protein
MLNLPLARRETGQETGKLFHAISFGSRIQQQLA